MTPTSFLILDSNNSTYNVSSNNSTYTINSSAVNTMPNSFNTNFVLSRPLYNVKKLYLKSLSFPVIWNNIRAANQSNTLTITNSGTNYTITLPDRTYTSVATLIARINTEYATVYPALAVNFQIYTTDDTDKCYGNVAFSSTLSAPVVQPSILATMLGFSSTNDILKLISTTYYRIASSSYNIFLDSYVNMLVYNLVDSNVMSSNGVRSSFYIPVTSSSGNVLYNSSGNQYDSYIQNSSNVPITNFGITFVDRWGYSIPSRGADWTAVLMIEYNE